MFKFTTILLIQILCGMEMDLFIPSFPELQRVFNITPVIVQMTISVNFIVFCTCCLFAGSLGDRYNRRHVLLAGLLLFVMGSLVCVMAPNFSFLIVGRVLQGIGISAPAILSFPILLEDDSSEKHPGILGLINGVKTLAMAVAPVIGSFVNLYCSWQGNFSVLLGLGFLCFITSYLFIPDKKGDTSVSLSLKSYLPLLKSSSFLIISLGLSCMTAAYWLFLGMAPIFYMGGMNVPLQQFGFYQGSLSLSFAMMCISSPLFFKIYGKKCCFYFGVIVCLISTLLIFILALLQIREPWMITAILMMFSVGIVFPINILYPVLLETLPHAKGRSAGLGQFIVLLLTAMLLELVSYDYNNQFMPIGLTMVIVMIISFILIKIIIHKKWLFSDEI